MSSTPVASRPRPPSSAGTNQPRRALASSHCPSRAAWMESPTFGGTDEPCPRCSQHLHSSAGTSSHQPMTWMVRQPATYREKQGCLREPARLHTQKWRTDAYNEARATGISDPSCVTHTPAPGWTRDEHGCSCRHGAYVHNRPSDRGSIPVSWPMPGP
jgi:hypothetical protein